MGKTTLAQLVYNDPRVKKHFELKAWVYVSETFDIIALTKAILEKVGFLAHSGDLDILQHQLKQELRRKKYLIVLDDVSDANFKHLEELLLPLKNGSFGSNIVVTTRSKEVARSIDLEPKKIQDLEQLKKRDCWKLFVRHAFHGKRVNDYPRLKSIGKSLLEKCRGLPLAVKTLGKLLRKKFSPYKWEKILNTDLWHIWERDINYNPILRLGYHNLHANLKRCFAYCSIFPKGYKFEKDKLIKLWMAEGLLCDTYDKEEEVGCKFFDDLESISFFQASTKYSKYFVMHDLVTDLATLVSRKFSLQIEIDKVQDIPERTRHISCFVERGVRELSLDHVYKTRGLRSLMLRPEVKKSFYTIGQHDVFSRLKYLRMLSLYGCGLKELADEISNLKLLRYLDMSCTEIKKLPESICMLHNLQTLLLRHCQLTELPSDFYKLVNLHHLDLLGNFIKKMPKQIGNLHHLHTLTNFVVGEQSGGDVKELAKLNNLEGILCISGLGNVIDPTDAAEANLNDKKYLEELEVTFKYNSGKGEIDGSIIEREVSVLEALQPNSNLNSLTIELYRGSRFPNWLGDFRLSNLDSLRLYDCPQLELFPAGGLPSSLRKLEIQNCLKLIALREDLGFPSSLRSLIIFNCPKLIASREEWGLFKLNSLKALDIHGEFDNAESFPEEKLLPPNLKMLHLIRCSKLRIINYEGLLHLKSLTRLSISDCPCLERLPEEGLPNSLSELHVRGCSLQLKQMYEKETGERWHKISHIPHVSIHGPIDRQ